MTDTTGANLFEAAYTHYLASRADLGDRPPGTTEETLDLRAIAESGYTLPAVFLGALMTGQRLADTPETGDDQTDLSRATGLQDAAGFLERHRPAFDHEVGRVAAIARSAGDALMHRAALRAADEVASTGQEEVPASLRRVLRSALPGTLYGYRAFSRMAADVSGATGPTFSFSALSELLRTPYSAEGAPPPPSEIFETLAFPLIRVGILEVTNRQRGREGYRIASPEGRDQHPTRNVPGMPTRVHLTPTEALILCAQLNRLEAELTQSNLPTIDSELAADMAERVEPQLRMEDSEVREARRLIADKIGRLRAAPRLIWLLKESLPEDDPRQRLFDYIARLPSDRMRLIKGYVGESTTAVTFAGIRAAISEVQVRRDIPEQ